MTLWTLAERGEGDAAAIHSFIDEALTVWRELGERRHFAFSLCDLGIVASMQGQFEEALRSVDESFSIFTALDDDLGVNWAFVAYSKLLARHGQLIDAWTLNTDHPDAAASLRQLARLRVDQITTDEPIRMEEFFAEIASGS